MTGGPAGSADSARGGRERPISTAVIGYGATFGMGRSHLTRMSDADGLEPVAVCDVDPGRLAAAASDFPGLRTFSEVDGLLASGVADLVTVVTPNHTHFDVALRCIEAGLHVVVEKPMCLTFREASTLMRASSSAGTLLTVYHIRRLDGPFLTVRAAVEEGRIGEVHHVELARTVMETPIPGWRSRSAECGGPHYDWGSHMVDWVLGLTGSAPDTVRATFRRTPGAPPGGLPDRVEMSMALGAEVTARVHIATRASVPCPAWRVLGEDGGLLLHGPRGRHVEVWSRDAGPGIVARLPVTGDDRGAFYPNVVGHLRRGDPLLVPAVEGARVVACLRSASRSARRRGAPVSVREIASEEQRPCTREAV